MINETEITLSSEEPGERAPKPSRAAGGEDIGGWPLKALLRVLRRVRQGIAAKTKKAAVAEKLGDKLWGGFSRYALRDLEELRRCTSAAPSERSKAAWHLARWYAFEHDYTQALDYVVFASVIDPTHPRKDHRLLEVDCLVRLGRIQEARRILDNELSNRGYDPDLFLAYANTYFSANGSGGERESDAARLNWINRIYKERGLLPLTKTNPLQALAIDNIGTEREPSKIENRIKVSVVVPAYNVQNSLAISLRALLAQTWTNLEILVVDDCSLDDTIAVAESYAQLDSRVIVIRQKENLGAYVARNRALEVATGDLITAHDADDWSHPQKIEAQVSNLLKEPSLVANCSYWTRVTRDLTFNTIAFRSSRLMVHPSLVSTLFLRSVFDRCGAWDSVRVGADKEFIHRVRREFGYLSLGQVSPSIPLSFALDDPKSLTRNRLTHAVTVKHGVRREYNEAAAHWRASSDKRDLRLQLQSQHRSFPASGAILSRRQAYAHCDVLFVFDFNASGHAFISTMNYVGAAIAQGLSVALFQWRLYDQEAAKPLNPAIRQMAQEGKLRIVAPGDRVSASTVIIGSPVILQHAIDLCPKVQFSNLLVLVGEMMGGVPYDPRLTCETLKELFGTEGTWVPLSEHVRRRMMTDSGYPAPHSETWTPLIDTATWAAKPLRWAGRERQEPVIGSHHHVNSSKWPSLLKTLSSKGACEVRSLSQRAVDVAGSKPLDGAVPELDNALLPDAFFELDFFIHYPQQDNFENFDRSLFEALAAGCPVLLPPIYERTFGTAAVYAEPEHVWGAIQELWRDEATYLARAKSGRDFVLANCDWKQLTGRLSRLCTA